MSDVDLAVRPAVADSVDAHPLFRSRNRLKLATFAWNLRGGHTPTLAEGPIRELDWAQQLRIVKKCEAVGLDAVIPVSRWKSIGGKSDFWGQSYETIPWSAALAAVTERLTIFSTNMVPLVHPIRAAKTAATIDHIASGRFGLNIVAGWNQAEFDMFGYDQLNHDERYAEAEEWIDFVKKLWTANEPFDWNGKYYRAKGAESFPHPLKTRPLLMSAGSSAAGKAFAAKTCDLIYIVSPSSIEQARTSIQDIKAQAAAHGRTVQVWCTAGVMCCATEAEAQRRYDHFAREMGDRAGAEAFIKLMMGGDARSAEHVERQQLVEGVLRFLFAYPLIGTPEQVVEKMAEMSDAGLDGMGMVFLNYEEGLDVYERDILPLAQSAGLRI